MAVEKRAENESLATVDADAAEVRAGDVSETGSDGGSGWLAIGLAVAATLVAGATVAMTDRGGFERAEVGDLAGLLIGGLLTFLFGTAAIVATFHALGLSRASEPLGLPPGTIQAFIALFLILLFFIMSTFLYLNVSQTTTDPVLRNLTQSELEQIPTDQITAVSSTTVEIPVTQDDGTQGTQTEERFTVVLNVPAQSEVAEEIARQLITTIGTLIVAIAAFYFGAKSIGGVDT